MNCSSCEKNFPETATFCPFCGEETPRHITTMLGGISVEGQQASAEDIDAHWETLLGGFEVEPAVSGETVVKAGSTPQIVAETVILAEDPVPLSAPYNRTLVGELVRDPSGVCTAHIAPVVVEDDPVEDFRPWRRHLGRIAVVLGLVATVGAGIFVGAWLSEQVSERDITARQAVASTAPKADTTPQKPAAKLGVRRLDDDGFELLVDDEVVHTVSTAEGSRYETLEARARSIDVRLQHVADKASGGFHARVAGDHWELVYRDGESDFRILDVTEADAALLDSPVDLVAQLLADRLNDATGQERPNT